jgi:hypothetical protein
LPIIIEDRRHRGPRGRFSQEESAGNIVAALGHPDRVRCIELIETSKSDLPLFTEAMNKPFPELTFLGLRTGERGSVLVLPDSFLGGSAPRLQTLWFDGVSFPPTLLSSVSDLVDLRLFDIPDSGYISPEAMVAGLSASTRLERLAIKFQSPRPRPGQPSPLRSIRTVLPALNHFVFRGVNEYLEDLTSRIDAPLLCKLSITFFNQPIFETPKLCSFISRAEALGSQSQAHMTFYHDAVELSHTAADRPGIKLMILYEGSDRQLSSLTQVCDLPFLSVFNLERLKICEDQYIRPDWQRNVQNLNTQWLELLHRFTTVKSLSLSKEITPRVLPALQELSGQELSGERMDVLPALQSIFLPWTSLPRPVKMALAQFLTARQLSGRPVAVNPKGEE